MPGTKRGTGRPAILRCLKCRKGRQRQDQAAGTRLEATGFFAPLALTTPKADLARQRLTDRLIQYRCLDCQHLGWTQHLDGEMLLDTQKDNPEWRKRGLPKPIPKPSS